MMFVEKCCSHVWRICVFCKNFLKHLYQLYSFQIGSERYGGPFRYLGHRAIFPRQTLRAAGIWILTNTNVSIAVGIIDRSL